MARKTSPRFKRRVCGQCGNNLARLIPIRSPQDDSLWNDKPQGRFYCEKCDLLRTFPLVSDEMRDIELAPRARA